MIRVDFKNPHLPETERMNELKKVFPSFFRKTNPEPVIVHTQEHLFFMAKKSFTSSAINPNADQMVTYKAAPADEHIQLSFYATDSDGVSKLFSYSTKSPDSKDTLGLKFEYGETSGNMWKVGNNTMLYPQRDEELLYFLYYYAPMFSNGKSQNPDEAAKYYFFTNEQATVSTYDKRKKEAEWTVKIDAMSADQRLRALKAMFKAYSETDDTANANSLFETMIKATSDQLNTYNEIMAGGSASKVAAGAGEKDMAVWIDEWIENEKIVCIAEDTEDKKKGWYWKPKEGEGDQTEWLKSPIPGIKIIDGVVDQRIALSEQLLTNTGLFEKLKTRW